MRRSPSLLLLALAIVAGGCSPDDDGAEATATPEDAEPGDVLEAEPVGEVDGVEGSMWWRVRYRSLGIDDEPIEVTGYIARPPGDAPDGGFPVVSWAHGTTGTADACAPSIADEPYAPDLAELLEAGYVVAATDYQGLGTPGLHPYLVGESEGRGVLDAARAAIALDGVDAGPTVVVWGHSQGGHAALFAGELAPSHAPELDVRGVVAFAPAGDLRVIGPAVLQSSELFPFALLTIGTWVESYPEIDPAAVFGAPVLDLLPELDELCIGEFFTEYYERDIPAASLLAPGAEPDGPPLHDLFAENTPGVRPMDGPVLIAQGEVDELVLPGLTDALVPILCAAGADVDYRTYAGADHGTVLDAASDDVLAWTAARFAGDEAAAPACA